MSTVKRFEDCHGSITAFLNPGDIVDDDFYYYFLEVLPPAQNTARILQIGEPYDHDQHGQPTFLTLLRDVTVHPDYWYYAGTITESEARERTRAVL